MTRSDQKRQEGIGVALTIRYGFPQPFVVPRDKRFPGSFAQPATILEAPQFPELVGSYTAILLALAIQSLLGNANIADRIHPRRALPNKYLNLPQLRNNLFRLMSLRSHFDPPFS